MDNRERNQIVKYSQQYLIEQVTSFNILSVEGIKNFEFEIYHPIKEIIIVPKRDDAKLYQLFIGKADFFFCHWFAESENAIIETLSQAGADDFMITMAIEISIPKMDLEKMKSLIETIK